MDTVVVDPFRKLARAIESRDMSLAEWRSHRERGVFEAFECGEIDEEEYLRRFYKSEIPESARQRLTEPTELKELLYQSIDFVPGMPELLAQISNDWSLVLGSNYGPWYREVLRLRPELTALFPRRFFSCELGVRKPDPRYYKKLQEILQTQNIGFIDDRPENLTVPREMGWKVHRFENAETLSVWLRSLGSLPGS